MKRETAKKWADLYAAYAAGKTVQWRIRPNAGWEDVNESHPTINGDRRLDNFRIKPEPKLRPWNPDDVPVGAQFRFKGQTVDRWLISGTSSAAIRVLDDLNVRCYDFNTAFDRCEWSNDNGETWHPCGVEVVD